MKRRAALIALLPLAAALPIACSSAPPAGPTARACTIAAPAPSDWRLRADGTLLRDGLDRVVSIRGVDAGGRSKTAPFVPFDYTVGSDASYKQSLASYMDRAAAWGIDVLRVPFVWEAVEPTQGTDDEEFLGRFDQLLDAAWARGIWTIVDFHQDVYSQNFCGDGFPGWTIPEPKPAPHHDCQTWPTQYSTAPVEGAFDRFWATGSVQTAYLAMWDRMVARYKDRPGVIGFEPINEPSAGSASPDTWEATTLSAFYATMAGRIRGAAPKALVFLDLSGPDGSFLISSVVRPQGDGIVFAPHFYPLLENDPMAVHDAMQRWATIGGQWNAPTFVGEFGVKGDSQDITDYLAAHFAAFDALGIGGSEWEYSVSATSWNDEGMSLVDGDGTEHGTVAAIARPFARAVAGSSIAASWDASAQAFTLSYAPTGGITEVSLPTRASSPRYDVSLTGGCYDATSVPGRMLVQPDPGATTVSLRLSPR